MIYGFTDLLIYDLRFTDLRFTDGNHNFQFSIFNFQFSGVSGFTDYRIINLQS